MSWVITIAAGVVAPMLTDAASSPAIIGDYCVPNWAEMKSIHVINKKSKDFYTKGNNTEKRSD